MCEHIDKRLTFRSSQLEDGDIVSLSEKPLLWDVLEQCRYPDVPSFLEYMHNRQSHHIGLDDPSKIRLTSHKLLLPSNLNPSPSSTEEWYHLSDMLVHLQSGSEFIPLDCQNRATVGDVELSHPNAELRLLEVFYHKIYKVPEEEKNLAPHDRLIHVYHFMKDTTQNQVVQNFGEPFFLVIHEGETLTEVKIRIQKKLQVPDEEFSKWKFAFLSLGRPEYLQDSDIVSSRFQRRDVYGAWEQYLGLEHSDNAPKRSYAANQNRHTFEKPVKIYN
ncbi:hypothetical protein NC652_020098 [Populus alba x Populus x berolinensis]|nr:hypothetical protein NC652_020098 [Populus alba x Populus x berolinensis]